MAAVCMLTTVAEVMRHHGVNLYGYQEAAQLVRLMEHPAPPRFCGSASLAFCTH